MIATGQRIRRNAWGRYYVTDECDGCGVCATCAPVNFEPAEDGTYYYLVQQPYDDWEEGCVQDAMDACPKQCIRASYDDDES